MKQSNSGLAHTTLLATLFMPSLTVALAGCGSNDISKLKAQALDANPSYTVGQAFDNRKVCSSATWKETSDDRNRKIIEYNCNLIIGDFNQQAIQAQVAQLKMGLHNEQEGLKAEIDKAPHSLQIQQQAIQNARTANLDPVSQRDLDQQQQALDSATAAYQAKKANEDQALADIQKKYDDAIAKTESGPVIKSGIETFQWTVNDDGFTMIFAGRDLQVSDGSSLHQPYSSAKIPDAIAAMIRNDATSLKPYIQEVPWPY